jgi:hypothetical protein
MECKDARLLLNFVRPRANELDAAEARALDRHLRDCPDCEAHAQAERRLDEHLGKALRDVSVPSGLRSQVLARLAEQRKAKQYHRLRRLAVTAGGLAAALLLGLTLWQYWPAPAKPPLDLNDLHSFVASHTATNREWVQESFALDDKVLLTLPERMPEGRLNYDLITDFGLKTWQQRQLPYLRLDRGDKHAFLFVISDKQFDTRHLALPVVFEESQRYAVYAWRDAPGFVYVLVHTGDSVRPFLDTSV